MGDAPKPDFAALRAARNESVQAMIKAAWISMGGDPNATAIPSTFNPNACYCACPDGPCEHDFQGWRDFEDGSGGEQVCSRCGCGAMHHSLMTGP